MHTESVFNMIKQTIICDRCGREASVLAGTYATGYVTLRIDQDTNYSRHLCPDCKTAFRRFMENVHVTGETKDFTTYVARGE